MIDTEMERLMMIPGPTPVDREILAAISRPTVAHTSAALAEVILDCQVGLRYAAGTSDASTFLFAGAGTLAQEAAVINLVPPGERLLVVSNGYFGDRFASIARAYGINVDLLEAEWGTYVSPSQVRDQLSRHRYAAVTLTHVDTSTGVAAPVAELARAIHETETLSVLDSVCALGGMPVEMDSWGIDVVLTGAQKALGVPPGLALLLLSERALNRRHEIDRVPAFYADLANWEASMSDPKIYFSTHAVNLFYALQAALEIVRSEGLDTRFARHQHLGSAFRAGMEVFGFSPLTQNEVLAPTLSVLAYPSGVNDEEFRSRLAQHGVIAAGCLGSFKGRGIRFGHMGNIGRREIEETLLAVGETLKDLGQEARSGTAVNSALSVFN